MENIYYVYDKGTGFIKGATEEKDFETVMINIFNKELERQLTLTETLNDHVENLVRLKEKVKMLEDETRNRDLNITLSRNIASHLRQVYLILSRQIPQLF